MSVIADSKKGSIAVEGNAWTMNGKEAPEARTLSFAIPEDKEKVSFVPGLTWSTMFCAAQPPLFCRTKVTNVGTPRVKSSLPSRAKAMLRLGRQRLTSNESPY